MMEAGWPERPVSREHHLEVRRTARYYTLGETRTAREVWFLVHGYGQLARRFLRQFRPLVASGRLLVAPEALNRYYTEYEPGYHRPDARVGATWMTREDRAVEIEDYVAYLDDLYHAVRSGVDTEPEQLVLFGYSQGAATAARWAASGTAVFQRIILWGGLLPPDLDRTPALFRTARLTFVFGRTDAYASAARVQAESVVLRAAGLEHQLCWFDGGHEIDADTLVNLGRAVAGSEP